MYTKQGSSILPRRLGRRMLPKGVERLNKRNTIDLSDDLDYQEIRRYEEIMKKYTESNEPTIKAKRECFSTHSLERKCIYRMYSQILSFQDMYKREREKVENLRLEKKRTNGEWKKKYYDTTKLIEPLHNKIQELSEQIKQYESKIRSLAGMNKAKEKTRSSFEKEEFNGKISVTSTDIFEDSAPLSISREKIVLPQSRSDRELFSAYDTKIDDLVFKLDHSKKCNRKLQKKLKKYESENKRIKEKMRDNLRKYKRKLKKMKEDYQKNELPLGVNEKEGNIEGNNQNNKMKDEIEDNINKEKLFFTPGTKRNFGFVV